MRERRNGGGASGRPYRRSRSRSRSLPPHKTAHLPRYSDDGWRYSRSYYRSPSPVRPDRLSRYKLVGSLPRTASVRREHRYGDYYNDIDGVGSVRTQSSPHRTERRDHEEVDGDSLRSSGAPVWYGLESSSYRARDYDYDREVYKEEREGYFRKVARRKPEGLRFRYDSVSGDKLNTRGLSGLARGRVGGVSDFGVGTVPVSVESGGSRGYFGQLVDRSGSGSGSEYGRGGTMNSARDVGGGYVSPPALRKCEVERGSLGSVPGEFPTRTSVVKPIARKVGGGVVGSLFRDGIRESNWVSDGYGSIRDRYADIGRVTPLKKERDTGDEGYLKSRRSFDSEEVKLVEESSCGGNVATGGSGSGAVGIGSYGDGLGRSHAPYERLYTNEGGPRGYKGEDLGGIHEQSEVLLQSKHGSDIEMSECNHKTDWYPLDGICASRNMDGEWINEDLQQVRYVDDLGSGNFRVRRSARAIDMMVDDNNNEENESNNPFSPTHLQVTEKKHWSKPHKPFNKDIKKRLGPAARNVKLRLGPVQNVKQRLGPIANAGKPHKLARKVSRKLPWVEIYERRIMDDVDRSVRPQPVEPSEVKNNKLAMVKTEPPEVSEEFAQLVQSAFLKFVKLLNENSAYRRRYLEQGGSGPFKCSACGSSSEFADTLSLAQHAFQSCKVGCRSEHLGFHKAICVLMGWKCAEVPNSSWVHQILPASEASSVKEDLIIWPPVVFIHNSSIAKGNPDNRIVVSIEQLRNVLKGMGFGQCMTNLCRGKAANQSVMVASFAGTLSGLGEAERLHRLYSDYQHGRVEFQQITSGSSGSSSEEAQKLLTDKVESVLYGYLGTAGDLDKLDFETKKKCQVKSRKKIEAIADAPLTS